MNKPSVLNLNHKEIQAYYFFAACVVILILCPLFSKGMFLDGVTYAAIAKNLSLGIGSPLEMYYTDFHDPVFTSHLPLGLWMQALFFKILGNYWFVERIYCLCCFFITLFIMSKIWTYITADKTTAWLPLTLFILMPDVAWSFSNNVLETTVCVFSILSLWIILKSIEHQNIVIVSLAAISIFCAILAKSPAALFLFTIPFFLGFSGKVNANKAFNYIIKCLLVFLFIGFFVWCFTPLGIYFESYLKKQFLPALASSPTADTFSYRIIKCLFNNLILGSFLIALQKFRNPTAPKDLSFHRYYLAFLLVGLSGSLPILLSIKQSCLYIVPSLMFFALSFAVLLYPSKNIFLSLLSFKRCGIVIFVLSLLMAPFLITKNERDVELRREIKESIVEGRKNNTPPSIDACTEWIKVAYYARYSDESVKCND